jgi:outer membrane lipoprotein SlyB
MKISTKVLTALLAATAFLPLAMLPGLAQAQAAAQAAPRIEGFNVEEVRSLTPGTELNFEFFGTPGGLASLHIEGAKRNLTLVEVESGQYEGAYTISNRDKIGARSPVTANLRIGNQVATLILKESLTIGVGYHGKKTSAGAQPQIDHFTVNPVAGLKGGNELYFSLAGTPGGQVDLVIQGVKGKVLLPEVKNGEYASTYTIRSRDRIVRNSTVTANLRLGERVTSTTLGKPLQNASAPVQSSHVCNTCGTVESVNLVEVKGEGGYLGAIGGGVVGALSGSQVGQGTGRTVAQIAGAVGGAYAGRAIEAKSRTTNHHEVVVRLHNGSAQTVSFATDPGFQVGDKVKVNAGVITHNP